MMKAGTKLKREIELALMGQGTCPKCMTEGSAWLADSFMGFGHIIRAYKCNRCGYYRHVAVKNGKIDRRVEVRTKP